MAFAQINTQASYPHTNDMYVGNNYGYPDMFPGTPYKNPNQMIAYDNYTINQAYETRPWEKGYEQNLRKQMFCFVKKPKYGDQNRPVNTHVIVNLPTLNWILAKQQYELFSNGKEPMTIAQVEDEWAPVGVCVTEPSESNNGTGSSRNSIAYRNRLLNFEIAGASKMFNIFGNDICETSELYYLIKKIDTPLNPFTRYTLGPNGGVDEVVSHRYDGKTMDGIIQIIPYSHHCHHIPPPGDLDYYSKSSGTVSQGSYWRIGKVHRASRISSSRFALHTKHNDCYKDMSKIIKNASIDIFLE